MEFREATTDDAGPVRSIASESLSSSYTEFLPPAQVETAVANWYDEEAFEAMVDADDAVVVIADEGDGPVAFSQSELVGTDTTQGQIHWLHVAPGARGSGTGSRLLRRTRAALVEGGADEVRAFVLAENDRGNRFYADHGFERVGSREVTVGDETFPETVYVERDRDDVEWGELEPVETADGTVYVAYGQAVRGKEAPFYAAYETADSTGRYGWFCGNCDSLDNAMDAMGHVECNRCGNTRKATRWDAAYL